MSGYIVAWEKLEVGITLNDKCEPEMHMKTPGDSHSICL